jgi:HAD superfamily hydrolase (TIGR01662 family)
MITYPREDVDKLAELLAANRDRMLYIFDKDGTLVSNFANRPANTPAEQTPLPNVVEKLNLLRRLGDRIAIASNQGGVAWNFISYGQAIALVEDVAAKVGGVDAWEVCPHDARAIARDGHAPEYAVECECRKPLPGMLLSLMAHLGFTPDQTVMVGDSDSDRLAARTAGCEFVWAREFFEW